MEKIVLNEDSDFSGYSVIDVDIKNDSPIEWLEKNRSLVINESVTAAEKILYENINEFVPVLKLNGTKIFDFMTHITDTNKNESKSNKPIQPYILIGLDRSDIDTMLKKSMDWCVDAEEYEICHRVKLLQEWISSNSKGDIE